MMTFPVPAITHSRTIGPLSVMTTQQQKCPIIHVYHRGGVMQHVIFMETMLIHETDLCESETVLWFIGIRASMHRKHEFTDVMVR